MTAMTTENKNVEVNYKNKKRYKTAKYPIRQPILIVWLIWLLSKIVLIVDMLAGRLEIFPILVLFLPRAWKRG